MKLYRCYFATDDEWQILLVAPNARQARRVGFAHIIGMVDYAEWTDCRARLVKHVAAPPAARAGVIETCYDASWTCMAWGHDECSPCSKATEDAERGPE